MRMMILALVLLLSNNLSYAFGQEFTPEQIKKLQDEGKLGPGTVRAIISATGEIQYYFIPLDTGVEPTPSQLNPSKAQEFWNLAHGSLQSEIFQVSKSGGEPVGVLYAAPGTEVGVEFGKFAASEGYQVSRLQRRPSSSELPPGAVRMERRSTLIDQASKLLNDARLFACESPIVPAQIEASANLGWGIEFGLTATWQTDKLCSDNSGGG